VEPTAGDHAPLSIVENEPPVDLSALPKLKDLTATTDMTLFLRKGVPENIRNAALRKSWALDPAIRNYVNPALDYAYDWNVPGGVPGSSELAAGTDIAQLVSQIIGGVNAKVPSAADAAVSQEEKTRGVDEETRYGAMQNPESNSFAVRLSDASIPAMQVQIEKTQEEQVGVAQTSAERITAPHHEVRRHGTAKPR
jgi:hypothetical protein